MIRDIFHQDYDPGEAPAYPKRPRERITLPTALELEVGDAPQSRTFPMVDYEIAEELRVEKKNWREDFRPKVPDPYVDLPITVPDEPPPSSEEDTASPSPYRFNVETGTYHCGFCDFTTEYVMQMPFHLRKHGIMQVATPPSVKRRSQTTERSQRTPHAPK